MATATDDITGAEPIEVEISILAARTERLEPLFDAAVLTFVWGFRIGAGILALGVLMALVQGEPLGREADPIARIPAEILAGHASGIIDLAILWFMLTPVAATVVTGTSFWRLGDRRYAGLCLAVLIILGVSIALALNR